MSGRPPARTASATGPPADGALTYPGLALLVLIWAANFSIVKVALRDFEPLAFNGLRFTLASVLLLATTVIGGRLVRIERGDWRTLIGLGIIGNTFYQVFFIYGLDWTLAGNSALMLSTTPVFVTLLSVGLRHERVGWMAWSGVILSFVGIALVVLGGARAVGFSGDTVRGDLTTLAAAFVWSIYTVMGSPLVRKYGALPVTAIAMWIGGAGLLLVSIPSFIGQDWTAVRPISWAALAYSGIFAIAVAYFLWYFSVRNIGSTRTAVYSNFIPIVALVIAWLMIGEVPTWLQIVGAAGIIGGVVLARLGRVDARAAAGQPPE